MFLEAVRLSEGDRPVGAVIAEAEYVARLPDGVDLAAAFARAADTAPLPVMRKSDKAIGRTIDVRQTLAVGCALARRRGRRQARLAGRPADVVQDRSARRRQRAPARGDEGAVRRRHRRASRRRAPEAQRRRSVVMIETVGLGKRFGDQGGGPRSEPARRGRRGDGLPGAQRLRQDHDHPPAHGPPASRARGAPPSWAATATPTRSRSSATSATCPTNRSCTRT